ncbi:MAG: metallophosphoesterase [Candidatus Micrarchaeota archaeon]|nr:metallophosphoesterase [Candidatus Micrarchaeota archaeon]
MLRVLAFSDLHGDKRALAKIKALAARNKYDAIFIAGDIVDHSGPGLLDELLAAIKGIPCFAIPGNIDAAAVSTRLGNAGISVDLQPRMLNGIEVFGIGGAVRGPFHTPNEYDDAGLWHKLSHIKLKRPSIVLSHSPPYGFFDDVGQGVHIGSRSVLRFMDENLPFLLVCGHVHQHTGVVRSGNTTIVKLPPAKDNCAAEILITCREGPVCEAEACIIRL